MKLSTETCTALAVDWLGPLGQVLVGDDEVDVSVRLAIAELVTLTSVKPAALILLRSTEAPIALEPMPASQAKTMFLIGVGEDGDAAGAHALTDQGLRTPSSSCPSGPPSGAVAWSRSSSAGALLAFRITEAIRKDTVVAKSTESVTPT